MIGRDQLELIREATAAITTAVERIDRLRDLEDPISRGTPNSRLRQLTSVARSLESQRGALERIFS